MDEAHFLIPRRLDDPPQFFLWDADEAVLVIFFVLLGALLVAACLGALVRRSDERLERALECLSGLTVSAASGGLGSGPPQETLGGRGRKGG